MVFARRIPKRHLLRLLIGCSLVGCLGLSGALRAELNATDYGQKTCKEFLDEAYKARVGRPLESDVTNWVRGFLSGMNVARYIGVSKKSPVNVDTASLRVRVELHCQRNPADTLITLGTKLYLELARANAG